MDIFKNLKSIFIVEEAEGKSTESPAPETNNTSVSASQEADTSESAPKQEITGKAEERFLKVLYDAVKKQGKDGFDYLEFKESLVSLEKLSMDEQTRYQSAFAVAKTMGATPASLIEAANYYLNVLHNEEKAFEATLNAQIQSQIGDKQAEQQRLRNKINEQNAQIEELRKEISEHQNKLDTLDKTIGEASLKIEQTKQNFFASYTQLADQMKEDIEKMKQYLK